MQLKAAYILGFGGVWRTAEKLREVLDPLHIVVLGLLRELAHCHFFDHAPTQRAHCLFGHGDAPVLSEGSTKPLISKQDAPERYPDQYTARRGSYRGERFSPMAHRTPAGTSALPPPLAGIPSRRGLHLA